MAELEKENELTSDEQANVLIGVGGMTCAACVGRVERAICALDGVSKVFVNIATEKAAVTFDKSKVRQHQINEAIKKAGYTVIEDGVSAAEKREEQKRKELKAMWTKLIVSACFALPLLYVAMVPMLPFAMPFSHALHTLMEKYPLAYALIQLALVVPSVCVGYKFYTVGYKALFSKSPNMDSLIAVGTSAAIIFSIYSTVLIAMGDGSST